MDFNDFSQIYSYERSLTNQIPIPIFLQKDLSYFYIDFLFFYKKIYSVS